MASATKDLIEKKMIYLYLSVYAEQNPDLAIMAIASYQRDCKHPEPKIRGMALRSLCSLRFSGSFEYMQPAILEALKDLDGYVRKTAILGCVKLFYVNPGLIRSNQRSPVPFDAF
jgi:AP-4 complex subunit beta-1